jgi:uncharacterized protein (TIGR03000 family)
MQKFIAAALVSCALGLWAWASPALAQQRANRTGGDSGAAKRYWPYWRYSNSAGQSAGGYNSYLSDSFWPRNFDYSDVYPHKFFTPFDVSPENPLSPSIDEIRFPSPMYGGYFHSDDYRPSYGAGAYSLLAASRGTGMVSRPASNNNGTAATVRVSLPEASARVSFENTPTQQTGAERVFVSPALEPGKSYTYMVRATWQENGQEVTRTKEVQVQAGRTTAVDFRAPVAVAGR